MILIELTASTDAAGTLQTFYLSTDAFVTAPADTPANTAFTPCLISPGQLGVHAFADGRTGGATRLETGEIVLANADGQFDGWLNYSFDGRACVIRSGISGAYPGAFPAVLTGTVESIEADWHKIVIRLRDKAWRLDKPALETRYLGDNILPGGLEGTGDDLKGRVKPRAYGKVMNVAPPQVNTSRLIYETGICNGVDALYDRGLALAAGAAYISQSDMETNAPVAGQYRAWPAGGYVRLGSTPAGQITADLTQGAAASNRTAAQMLKRLAEDAGLTPGEISGADVTALDAANSNVLGIWLGGEITFAAAMDGIANSIGAWYGFDPAGVLRMGRLAAPGGTPAITLRDYDTHDGIERRPLKDGAVPVWRTVCRHTRNWTVQASDLAGAVTAARRAALAEEWRAANSDDAAIKTQWLLAGEMERDTLLVSASDAATEAARLLALYKVRRDLYDVPVTLDILTGNSLKLMDVVGLDMARFGMGGGKPFRLIGIRVELDNHRAILSLWG